MMRENVKVTKEALEYNLMHLKQIVFEVTDACNLRCKYCGYADLYEGYDKREDLYMPFNRAKQILDYLYSFWKKGEIQGGGRSATIGFYGGEPLLNVPFIKQTIDYIESLPYVGKKFMYNMTTNAMLLDRHMDFLAEKKFVLLISLDGDKEGQGYRVDAAGNNSFDRVYKNIQLLASKYPDYFNRYVNFNAVLHNRNSVETIHRFVKEHFNKIPTIAPLNDSGIRRDKVEEFRKTYQNFSDSLKKATNCEALADELFIKNPDTALLLNYVHYKSGNVFRSYNELLFDKESFPVVPTGTCIPFAKKMFVTVKGRILQCERINHEFALGQVTERGVEMDLEQAAKQHNEYIFKYIKQCKVCGHAERCHQCVFQIDDIHDENTRCNSFCTIGQMQKSEEKILEYMEAHPELYGRLLRNVVIRS